MKLLKASFIKLLLTLDWPTELLLKNRPFDFTGHPEEEKLIKDILLKEEGNKYFSLESKSFWLDI
ncbi:hypothetical protein BN1224_CV14_A_01610 [Chlamydia pneumoniae]|uniref:Uncharacterized protein n=1 Tax=Chlamydia pneumoniae TaxID=83558 RepID=A0A0F7XB70_CHLPN|nr:hypothetical protein BN1224_Wien1_A_01610 [Chlamydia pneumoniae]CRI36642.1 hypothetical protein BN1224_CV14_A_01610 [Chlamydia pneumoniae]CRI37767.1 hypothetical protein BN1224_CV15_B_00900 [Chlamydia pneumoniae]CRI38900.1 hypothetical protein BN1224_CWL011_A_01640 [Chlamydia pneumoniae]CRI40033.1 hypothetical protein CWL029c_B_00940 [Chlamydia pneumoniae]